MGMYPAFQGVVAFSDGKPASTFPEDALIRREPAMSKEDAMSFRLPRVLPFGFATTSSALLLAVSVASFALSAQPAAAAPAYCPSPAHASPTKVPPELVTAVAQAFEIDESAARDAAFVRCAGSKLMACSVGANLNCFKADTRRTLPGATAWCHDNPGSTGIPMSATGHDTIYEWSCRGGRAVAGKAALKVDRQGYIADNWKELR
jgi:hypothetical protein